MTDQEIRDWIGAIDCAGVFSPDDIRPLLKELLSYRSLNFLPCWRVWCPDQSERGWRAVAAFPSQEAAIFYRYKMKMDSALVLEGHEQPSETAR